MLCVPDFLPVPAAAAEEGKAFVEWSQFEYFAITSASGVHPSGTVGVRAREFIPAESIFPCLGVYSGRGSQCARFSPASVSPVSSKYVVNGHPDIEPRPVSLASCVGGVGGAQHTIAVGCGGWSFFPYCREPPPSLTLSTAGICTRAPEEWRKMPLYAGFVPVFDSVSAAYCDSGCISCVTDFPLSIVVMKRDVEPGEELLIAFNQFDGIGRLPAYTSPCPFLRIGTAVPLLRAPSSMQVLRRILAEQVSQAITDSYVKLLEDTAGTDARTTERVSTALLNLTKAVQQASLPEGGRVALPLVVPMASAMVNGIMASSACLVEGPATLTLKRPRVSSSEGVRKPVASVPVFAASFRVPQSFVP